MTLEVLQKEMIAAMKVAIDERCKDNITEELVNRVLSKEKKTMQEMIDTCSADRAETLNEYNKKMEIINEFAPRMMSEDEVRKAVYDIIAMIDISQTGKGAIMKAVMPKLKGKADGKIINKIVTEIVEKSGK